MENILDNIEKATIALEKSNAYSGVKLDGLQAAIDRMRSRGVSFKNELLAHHGFPVYVNEFVWSADMYFWAKETGHIGSREIPSSQ